MQDESLKNETVDAIEGVHIPADETFNDIPNDKAGPGPGQSFDPELAGIIGASVMMLFGVAEKARGEHWKLDPQQASDYGETCAAYYQKKFGDSELSPEWALVGASFALIIGPVIGEIELSKVKKETKQKGEENGDQSESKPTE